MSERALRLIEDNKRTKNSSLNLSSEKLESNTLKKIKDHIWLKKLNLHKNEIQEISFLKNLIQLDSLDLSNNQIHDYSYLQNLTQLQTLNLNSNQIKDISYLQSLPQLQYLFLSDNRISDISFLQNFTHLEYLFLSDNQIKDVRYLQNFAQLKSLYLSGNQISDISFLQNLTQLQTLSLNKNRIKEIRFLEKLTNLQKLNLAQNQITDIKPLLILLKNGLEIEIEKESIWHSIDRIGLRDNPITYPPIEIFKQGRKAIINWFDAIEQQGEEIVYEAKLMIIGDAGSGKTSLANKLKNLEAKLPDKVTETTIGIEISQLDFQAAGKPDFKVNIWDLGGQKIYHPLHQLFFTQRSLYVLVSDGRKDTDENDLTDFWIPAQELLGKDSPMLILFNKHGDIQPNMAFRNFQLQYPNIQGNLEVVDLLNDRKGTIAFVEEVEKYMRNLPQFVRGEKLPKLWAKIREAIHKEKENYISLLEFRVLCSLEGIKEDDKQDFLSDYLHDLGIILRFRDDPLLNKIVFLNPQWALDAIYKVLDHTRQHNNGVFTKDELLSVWKKHEFYDVQDELLALMLKFELCYKTNDSPEKYLVPSLLAKDVPNGFTWNKGESLCLYYEYEFMPKGIISRLIVRLNRLINKESPFLWREGVIFESKGTSAWLTRPNKNRIEIYAKGYKPSYLISLITDEIDDINSKYHFSERSKPNKYVPCICDACKSAIIEHYYKYEKLVEMDRNRKKTIQCLNKPYHDVNIKELLENIESKTAPLAKKIFVSYSKSDEDYKEEFKDHMITLETQGFAEIFDDRKIESGDEWEKVLERQINDCDYFVCLVSVGFLKTKYIQNKEIPRAFAQGKKIILLIIKSCDWEKTPIKRSDLTLGDLNAHNKGTVIGLTEEYKNGKAIPKEYTKTERDAMWVGVVNAIRGLIEKDK